VPRVSGRPAARTAHVVAVGYCLVGVGPWPISRLYCEGSRLLGFAKELLVSVRQVDRDGSRESSAASAAVRGVGIRSENFLELMRD
jgi:hypothetical protein